MIEGVRRERVAARPRNGPQDKNPPSTFNDTPVV